MLGYRIKSLLFGLTLLLSLSASAAPVLFCGQSLPPQTKKVVCQSGKITGLDALKALQALEELELHGIVDGSLEPLTWLPKLRKLTVVSPRYIRQKRTCQRCMVFLPPIPVKAIDLSPLARLRGLSALTLDGPFVHVDALRRLKLGTVTLNWSGELSLLRHLSHAKHLRLTLSVNDLKGLPQLPTLRYLSLSGSKLVDITPLRDLVSLRELLLKLNGSIDITPLAALVNLERLDLSSLAIRSITPLARLHKLRWLNLANTLVSDLSPIAHTRSLTHLYLSHTPIFDLRALEKLANLKVLDVSRSPIESLRGLEGAQRLVVLLAGDTAISALTPIRQATNLRVLMLSYTAIRDLAVISRFRSLRYLGLMGTLIADISPLEALTELRELDLRQSVIAAVPRLRNAHKLVKVDLQLARVADAKTLRYLLRLLTSVRMSAEERAEIRRYQTTSGSKMTPQNMLVTALTVRGVSYLMATFKRHQIRVNTGRLSRLRLVKVEVGQLSDHPALKRATPRDQQRAFCEMVGMIGRAPNFCTPQPQSPRRVVPIGLTPP